MGQGVKSGELTKAETVRLAKQQKETRKDVKSATADGVLTKAERKDIKADKRKADRPSTAKNTTTETEIKPYDVQSIV